MGAEPGRASLVARIEGADPSRPALLVHGHLDVVPADPAEWSVHPFSGEERDGYIWVGPEPLPAPPTYDPATEQPPAPGTRRTAAACTR